MHRPLFQSRVGATAGPIISLEGRARRDTLATPHNARITVFDRRQRQVSVGRELRQPSLKIIRLLANLIFPV